MSLVPVEAPPSRSTLDELAERANREHAEVGMALSGALQHAVACGEALLKAREQFTGADHWYQWIENKLDMTVTYAGTYMRLAYYRDQLPAEAFEPWVNSRGYVRQPTLKHTLNCYLRGLPPIKDPSEGSRITDEAKAEMRRLHREGVPEREIAKLVGHSRTSVQRVIHPEKEAAMKQTARVRAARRKRERTALKREQKRAERRALAASVGGPLAEAYALVRRAAQNIDLAIDTARSERAKARAKHALTCAHTAEDAIVDAMRRINELEEAVTSALRMAAEAPPHE